MREYPKRNIAGILYLFLLPIFCFNIYTDNILFADQTQKEEMFVEADFFQKNGENFLASGHVIVKHPNAIVNADELEREYSLANIKRNIDTSNAINDINKASEKITKQKKYKFYARNWVKIRTLSDDILFAKSLFYDESEKVGNAENVQIYPGKKYNHMEIYSTTVKKEGCIYTMHDVTICPCKFFTDSNIEHNRSQLLSKTSEHELIDKPDEENSIDNNDKEMHSKLNRTFMSIRANDVIYDSNNNLVKFKHARFRLFGIPVFYLPSYSFHANENGDFGLLFPNIIFSGSRQVGVELPIYFPIRTNVDLIVSRMQYFNTGFGNQGYKYATDNAYKLKDLYRFKESSTQFRFRHLFSTNFNYENFYRIEAMMTDRTQLVDNSSGLGKVDRNGDRIMGYRWMVDFKTRMKLSNTTFLKADIDITSDKNVLYYLKFDPRQIQENKIHLYDVAENRYLSAQLFNYQMRLLYVDPKTNPIVFPVIRAEYDFKKDKLGGNFYVKSKIFYINREEGYSSATAGVDFGYHLPYFTKFGTKFTFDAMARSQFSHVDYNPYTSIADVSNYGGMLNSNYYIPSQYRRNQFSMLGFGKIQAEHPIIVRSVLGKTIITPRVALRSSPNGGRNLHIPVEDNLSMQMTYYNAFDLVQSSGFGIYDSGQSFVYGGDISHRFSKNFELFGGVAQNLRLGHPLDQELLAEYTGFRRSMSDVMSHFGTKIYNFSVSSYVNYDLQNKQIRIFGLNAGYSGKYFSIFGWYDCFSKEATILNYGINLLSMNINILPFKSLRLSASATYNVKGSQYDDRWKKAGFTRYSFAIYYQISCVLLGVSITKTNLAIKNTPGDLIYKFKIALKGF